MVSTRDQLIDYCLRELGAPIVEINVDELQVEDRIDEALEYWHQYHFEGVEKVYLKQQITASTITIVGTNTSQFNLGEYVVGQTSGARAKVCKQTLRDNYFNEAGNILYIRNIDGTFEEDETITGSDSNTSAVIAADGISIGTYDNKYFDLPDAIYGVTRVLPFSNASSSKSLFDLQYQLRLNDLYDLTSTSLIYYKTVMSHLALLDFELNGHPQYRFNRRSGKLYLDVNWEASLQIGDFCIVECYRALDPATSPKVYNEPWLKKYAAALIKRQWSANGKKFQGLQLPGGVSVDWVGMYNEAKDEIKELEDEMINKSAPLDFFMG